MDLKEAKEKCKELLEHNYLEDLGYLRVENHYIKFNTAIETILQELDNLQKENEKYISGELMTRNQAKHFEKINKKYYIHKDKIREKIEKIKNKPNNPNQKVIATQIDASLIACLQDLLKEE